MKPSPILLPTALLASLALMHATFAGDTPAPAAEGKIAGNDGVIIIQGEAVPLNGDGAPQAEGKVEAKAEVAGQVYLGVGTVPLPPILSKHLNLPLNGGVLVQSVAPAGPAAKAGLTNDDIVTKVDGKPISCQKDMLAIVRAKKAGDILEIESIHEGKPGKLSATLGECTGANPDDATEVGYPAMVPGLNPNLPLDLEARVKRAMEAADAADAVKHPKNPGGNVPDRGTRMNITSSMHMSDPQGSIEMKDVNGGKEARVLDNDGKEVWSGPWDTEQDKAAAPAEIRRRLDRMSILNGLNLRGGRIEILPQPAPPRAQEQDAKPVAPDKP